MQHGLRLDRKQKALFYVFFFKHLIFKQYGNKQYITWFYFYFWQLWYEKQKAKSLEDILK